MKCRRLGLEGKGSTELVGGLVQLLGVERSTETKGNTGSQSLGVRKGSNGLGVDLGLDKSRAVELVLGTNLKTDTLAGSRLGVPGGLGTDLGEGRDLVEVRRGEDSQVRGGSDSSSVGGGGVTKSRGVLGDRAIGNVVTKLGTNEETVLAVGGITSKDGTAGLEKVKESTAVESGLLEVEVQLSRLGTGLGEERGEELTLKTRSESISKLNLGVKDVSSAPALGESKTSGLIGVLALNGTGNGAVLLGRLTLDGESNTVGGLGLDFKVGIGQVVEVSGQQIVGRLSNIRESRNRHYKK